eukprot:7878231-Lingulodinium_polyedra.AAC.1
MARAVPLRTDLLAELRGEGGATGTRVVFDISLGASTAYSVGNQVRSRVLHKELHIQVLCFQFPLILSESGSLRISPVSPKSFDVYRSA